MSEISSKSVYKMDEELNKDYNSKLNEIELTEAKIKTQCVEHKDKEINKARSKTRLLKDVEQEERQIIYDQLYKSLLSDDDDDDSDNNDDNNNNMKNEVNEEQIVNEKNCLCRERQELLESTNKEADKKKLKESIEKETDNEMLHKTLETNTSLCNSEKSKEACAACAQVEKDGLLNRNNNNVSEKNTGAKKLYDMCVKTKAEMCGKSIQMMCMKQNAGVFSFFLYTSVAMFTLPIITLFLVQNVIAPMYNIERNISSGLSAIGVVIIIIMIYVTHTVKEE